MHIKEINIKDKIYNLNPKNGDIIHYEGKVYEYIVRFTDHGITYDRTTDYSNGEFYDFCGDEMVKITGNVNDIDKCVKFDDYQEFTKTTAVYPRDNDRGNSVIFYLTLGICGESGEIAEKVKKVIRDCDGNFTDDKKEELLKEIGDLQWYLHRLTDELEIKMSEVIFRNMEKLNSRKERNVLKGSGDNR